MTGVRTLLRRAQSPMRRARKMAQVTNLPLDEDWTAMEDLCPLPNYNFANKSKSGVRERRILKHEGDSLIRKYFEVNPKMAKVPVDMLSQRMIPIKTKVLVDIDPRAVAKNYPFTSSEALKEQIVEDGDSVAKKAGAGALRQVQEAEEIVLRRALSRARETENVDQPK